jgi:hypothetical protein
MAVRYGFMKRYTILPKDRNALWGIASVIFVLWLALILTAKGDVNLPALPLLVVAIYFTPIIGTFFIYVTVGEQMLTVPMGVFFRQSIPIRDIVELRLRRHGGGFMLGITVEYVGSHNGLKRARLPSFSALGSKQTKEMVNQLTKANPSIKIDPSIERALSERL